MKISSSKVIYPKNYFNGSTLKTPSSSLYILILLTLVKIAFNSMGSSFLIGGSIFNGDILLPKQKRS